MKHSFNHSKNGFACLCKSILRFIHILVFHVNPFWIELTYFIIFSIMGFLALKVSTSKSASFTPTDFDLFFTSVSSMTVTSLSTVEMEVFSNAQLILMTLLMFAGGEVFTSLLELQLVKFKRITNPKIENQNSPFSLDSSNSSPTNVTDQVELVVVSDHDHNQNNESKSLEGQFLMIKNSSDLLAFVILCYLTVIHLLGSILISIYYCIIPSAREVLRKKGLHLATFSVFVTVSTFANCGFIPTNENMIIFKKNSGLLLIMIPQLLFGNTLYPACLRFFIWFLQKISKREELTYILKNPKSLGYGHLLSNKKSIFLAITVFGFIIVQLIVFGFLEWHSDSTAGLSAYEKVVGSLFEVVNSRHAGESVFDLSLINPAMIVLIVLMMYLPPYTSFQQIKDGKTFSKAQKKTRSAQKNFLSYILFSQLTYLVIFIIIICITEREKMKEDPLNFNLLSIVFEVISGYGNVGFSMGYSCERRIKLASNCKDASYGFAGKWSNKGKFALIIVMLFGRLKKFSMNGGEAWILQ